MLHHECTAAAVWPVWPAGGGVLCGTEWDTSSMSWRCGGGARCLRASSCTRPGRTGSRRCACGPASRRWARTKRLPRRQDYHAQPQPRPRAAGRSGAAEKLRVAPRAGAWEAKASEPAPAEWKPSLARLSAALGLSEAGLAEAGLARRAGGNLGWVRLSAHPGSLPKASRDGLCTGSTSSPIEKEEHRRGTTQK